MHLNTANICGFVESLHCEKYLKTFCAHAICVSDYFVAIEGGQERETWKNIPERNKERLPKRVQTVLKNNGGQILIFKFARITKAPFALHSVHHICLHISINCSDIHFASKT